jgi:hypothetical protein
MECCVTFSYSDLQLNKSHFCLLASSHNRVKVNWSLLFIGLQIMNTYGGMEVQIHA